MTGAGDEVFQALLGAACRGQEWAWQRIMESVGPRVLSYSRSQGMTDPEDVLSDVLVDVVKNIHGFSGNEGKFRSWVFTIAHHRIVDRRRKQGRRLEVPLAEHVEVVDSTVRQVWADLGDLKPLIDGLPQGQRDVLLLRTVLGLSVDEVAEVLGQRPGAVRVAHHRALKSLRRVLVVGGVTP